MESRRYPFWTRVEAALLGLPGATWPLKKWHQLRKVRAARRWEARRAGRPAALANFERKVYSQYGEDGILAEVFRRIGEGGRYAVEFGIEDGSECNARLLLEAGWAGLLLDGSEAHVAAARRLHVGRPGVRVEAAFITAENILELFARYGVPPEPDLLSVDIDGNDFWVWRAILTRHRPRVAVVEYNARWAPPTDWVMPYDPEHVWDGSVRFGASLAALTRLGREYGYTLVGCNFAGNNAFFVRDDQLSDRFPDAGNAGALYAAPLYTEAYGHSLRPRH